MRQAQLYLWDGARRHYLALHDFYVEQMRSRILSQFDDLEGQARRFTDETYERLGQAPGREDVDMADIAEVAYGEGIAHYQALSDLRKQVLLGGLAGMFHQWDKTVREHLERELRRDFDGHQIERVIWKATFADLLGTFVQFGWPVTSQPFYLVLDALQLVVNVYKHGKGRSLTQLADRYGEYVLDSLHASMPKRIELDHERLTVTDAQFAGFAEAIRDFWKEMPEQLYLDRSTLGN